MTREYEQVTVADDGTVIGRKLQDGRWQRFIYPLDLLWIEEVWFGGHSDATSAMFLLQDGFGEPGKLERGEEPVNGARRSTPAARRQMLDVARRYLGDEEMAEKLGLTLDALDQVLTTAYSA